MAGMQPIARQRVCPEPVLDAEGKSTGQTCGRTHMGTCDLCPDCLLALANAFWATMDLPNPITGTRPATPVPAPPPPKRKRPGKRSRARKERS